MSYNIQEGFRSRYLRNEETGMAIAHPWEGLGLLMVLLLLLALPAQSVAEVSRYYAKTTAGGEMVLLGVTVIRGAEPATFDASKLIGGRLTHFKSNDRSNLVVPGGSAAPPV